MKYPSRPCPICGALDRKILHQQRFYDGVLGDGYDVVVCKHCGAGFADGILEQAELDRYYREQSKYTYPATGGAESEYDNRRFEVIVDQVVHHFSKYARILDVGCATGGLLSVFKRRGFVNLLGIDPSPACVEAAIRLHNIEVRTSTISQLSSWTEKFDLVLVVGVLEHIREVHVALENLKSRLTPAGCLYIAVPDVEGFAHCRNAAFQQFSMEHVNFFSKTSIRALMERAGTHSQMEQQWRTEWREDIMEPVISGLYGLGKSTGIIFDDVTEFAIREYIEMGTRSDERIRLQILRLAWAAEPVLVWGVGTFTRRLLAEGLLSKLKITAFVDSSVHHQGKQLAGFPIIAPIDVRDRNNRIVVGSVAFAAEIASYIRYTLCLPNDLIVLEC